MELLGNGLNKGSHMYFYTASQTAKKLLYYPLATGEFYCNEAYYVKRSNYNSILAIYVVDGNISLIENENEITAQKGEILLVDCYKEHTYFTKSYAHTLWIHFDGNNTQAWHSEIKSQKGQKIKCDDNTADCIKNIIEYIKTNKNEYDISKEIYTLICTISKQSDSNSESKKTNQVENAKKFIIENYTKNISVDDMARAAHISPSYFSKIFKETFGFSPYDYLLAIRLDKAKELLQKTDDSVQNIAYKSGFNSTSNFIYFFKKETGISPLKFRNIKF